MQRTLKTHLKLAYNGRYVPRQMIVLLLLLNLRSTLKGQINAYYNF